MRSYRDTGTRHGVTITAIEPRRARLDESCNEAIAASVLMTGRSPAYKATISPRQHAGTVFLSAVVFINRSSTIACRDLWLTDEMSSEIRTRKEARPPRRESPQSARWHLLSAFVASVSNLKSSYETEKRKANNLSYFHDEFSFSFLSRSVSREVALMLWLLRFALLLLCSVMNKS